MLLTLFRLNTNPKKQRDNSNGSQSIKQGLGLACRGHY